MFFFNRPNSPIQQIFGIPFSFSNYSRFIPIILILFPTINNSQQPPQNSTSSEIETSSPSADLVPHFATEAVEVPASILDGNGNTDQTLEQYFWEKVHRSEDCPLNCTTNTSSAQQQFQCWRLSGYLIPFICLPADFDPNSPFPPNGRLKTKNWLQWILSLTNAELVILALLFLNTFVGISTCFCVCVRRKCLGDKF